VNEISEQLQGSAEDLEREINKARELGYADENHLARAEARVRNLRELAARRLGNDTEEIDRLQAWLNENQSETRKDDEAPVDWAIRLMTNWAAFDRYQA